MPRQVIPLKKALALTVTFLLLSLFEGCRPRDEYPSRPIILLCPWAVGGGTDRVSRQVAAYLEYDLGVPVNVVNATGGAGVTGHSRGARAQPDGYTLMMMTVEINMLYWRELTDISHADFLPVMLLNRDAAAIFVRAEEERFSGVKDVIAEAARAPGLLTASGTAAGGIWHLALGGLLNSAGLSPGAIKWVPTNGAGPALQELASGGVDIVSCSLPEARTLLLSGKVKCLGVMADQRDLSYPEFPTVKEQGIEWSMGGWRGIGAPIGTPPRVIEKLSDALERIVTGQVVLSEKRFPDYMASEGFNLSWQRADEFSATLARTDEQLGALLTSREFSTINTDRFSPMHFPVLISAALALTLLGIFATGYWRGRSRRAAATPEAVYEEATFEGEARREYSRLGLIHFAEFVLAVILFLALAPGLGFLLTTGTLLFLLLWRMGTRLWLSALIAVLFVPAVYSLFGTLMRVPLPRGILGW